MGNERFLRLKSYLAPLVRPLIPLAQHLFGLSREAARKLVISGLTWVMRVVFLSFVTGAGILATIKAELNQKLHKQQLELAQRVDKLEKEALARNQPPAPTKDVATGALSREEQKRKQAEADCNTTKAKEVEALIYRRKLAYGELSKCINEWKPRWFSDETADQACAPKKEIYWQHYQDVKRREAKDCSATAAK